MESGHQLEQLAVLLLGDEIDHRRCPGKLRALFERGENEDVDLLVAQPIGLGNLERGQAEHAAAVRLAALDRQDRFLAADIAGHQLELGPKHVIEDDGTD